MGSRPAAFGEFLRPNKRPYTLRDDEDADLLGMRLYGGGPFHRELKLASKIRKKSHFVVRTGDVIYNKLFAWKGTFGIIPTELDGMFVSDKFPTYELDTDMVEPRYLQWYFKVPALWEQARAMSTGSAALSKFTLNPPRFLDLTIPLPEVEQQREIVDRLAYVEEKTGELRRSRSASTSAASSLVQSFVNRITDDLGALGTLGDVLTGKPRNGWSVVCDNTDDGTAVLTLGAVTGFNYNGQAIKRTTAPTVSGAHYWLADGDLLITRSNTAELVGHAAIYDGSPAPCIYSDLIMRIPVDPDLADVRFVWHWLQGPLVRRFVTERAKGTSPTMKKITQGIVMSIPFPSHLPVDKQVELRSQLDSILARREQLETLFARSDELVEQVVAASLVDAFGKPNEAQSS